MVCSSRRNIYGCVKLLCSIQDSDGEKLYYSQSITSLHNSPAAHVLPLLAYSIIPPSIVPSSSIQLNSSTDSLRDASDDYRLMQLRPSQIHRSCTIRDEPVPYVSPVVLDPTINSTYMTNVRLSPHCSPEHSNSSTKQSLPIFPTKVNLSLRVLFSTTTSIPSLVQPLQLRSCCRLHRLPQMGRRNALRPPLHHHF